MLFIILLIESRFSLMLIDVVVDGWIYLLYEVLKMVL